MNDMTYKCQRALAFVLRRGGIMAYIYMPCMPDGYRKPGIWCKKASPRCKLAGRRYQWNSAAARGTLPYAASVLPVRSSIGLLPDHLFRRMIEADKGAPSKFARKLRQLFAAMSDKNANGRTFGMHDIHYFNGGLFINDEVFDLDWRDWKC